MLKIKLSDIFQPSKLKCRTDSIRSFNNPECRTKYGSPYGVALKPIITHLFEEERRKCVRNKYIINLERCQLRSEHKDASGIYPHHVIVKRC